jgi:hypothetical protein
VEETGADDDPRRIKTRAHLIGMLHAQFTGARGLREVEANLKSHAGRLPQLVKQTLKITHFFGTSENAVRIQIAVALIAFLLLRLAHDANKIVASPLTFARLIRANLMHRRPIAELLKPSPKPQPKQPEFDFGLHATRAAHRRRIARKATVMEEAA